MVEPTTSGMFESADLYSHTPTKSYGTIQPTPTRLVSGIKCRFSLLIANEKDAPEGRGTQRKWRVLAHRSVVVDGLLNGEKVFILRKDCVDYSILRAKGQYDDDGNLRHVSLMVEKL